MEFTIITWHGHHEDPDAAVFWFRYTGELRGTDEVIAAIRELVAERPAYREYSYVTLIRTIANEYPEYFARHGLELAGWDLVPFLINIMTPIEGEE